MTPCQKVLAAATGQARMAQPQRYGSIREFLDNLPRQPCIWQPENQNICVTCLRINEPVARVCSVWSQALDDAPLEELDFEEEMRSLPAVEKVAETPATPGLVGIDVVGGGDAEPSLVEAVAAEPVVREPSIAVVDIEPVITEEPAEVDDEAAGLNDEEATDTAEAEVAEVDAVDMEADIDAEVVDAEAAPIAVVEASLVEAGTAATDATPAGTERPFWKFWGGDSVLFPASTNELAEAASKLDDKGAVVPEPDDDKAEELEPPLESEPEVLPYAPSDAPFVTGEVVGHAVYGSGTVRECVMTGQQWSVRVDFSTGERSILSHFLEGGEEDAYSPGEYGTPEVSAEEDEALVAVEAVEVEPEPEEETPLEAEAAAEEEAVAVPVEDDAGAAQVDEVPDGEAEADEAEPALVEPAAAPDNPFPPGCRVSHAFFGSGTVRESRSKDEHWRLEVEFEDGSQRPLLSSFVKLLDEVGEVVEAMPDAPQVVEAEPAPEAADTEPERVEEPAVESVTAEPEPVEAVVEAAELLESEPAEVQSAAVEAEPVAPLDLADPAVFEAEMIDELPVASPVIEPQPVPETEAEVPEMAEPVVVDLGEPSEESDPEVSAVGSLEAKQVRASGRGRRKGQKARCSKCGGEGHYAKTCTN
ncbi:MAG: hypothetical protein MK220_01795 [Candidatus Poseidoniia archaeon]|nr:hypothetical protein [Candidatus Poseidoniia archaeon]